MLSISFELQALVCLNLISTFLTFWTYAQWLSFDSMHLSLFATSHEETLACLLGNVMNQTHSVIDMIAIQKSIVLMSYFNLFATQ